MTNQDSPKDFPWKRSRYGFSFLFFLSLLVSCFVLRVVLYFRFGLRETHSLGTVGRIFLSGLHQDCVAALMITLPLLFWLWITSDRRFEKIWHRVLFTGGFFLFWTMAIFLFFTEYYFFDEFKSRFNTVAVDYLEAPKEVAGNIWASYPVALIVGVCVAFSLAWTIAAFRYFRQMWQQPTFTRSRFLHFAGAVILWLALWLSLNIQANPLDWSSILSWITARTQGTHFSENRTLNEIANNGQLSFINAGFTRNLDYSAYYRTLSRDEAYARTRKILTTPQVEFVGDQYSTRRKVAGDPNRPRLNVVILLEESLGSEFWGCLGRTNTLTPEMDKLALSEGLLFTNLYACGNRTVRGFEGVFSSFPPLPGDSIVKRDRSENVESIARVLKRDGYNTVFLYGGRGLFDGMASYALNNGWDRFLEHNPPFHDDFPNATFSTGWGVCDEEVFAHAIEEFRALHNKGKPFFGTVLSVSNHQPFTFPKGRLPQLDSGKPNRRKAVQYSDWSLGQFFQLARKEAFWTNTIFAVVADHGARVYGKEDVPIHSYEIPLVILGPAVVNAPQRIGVLGNSLDVAPTVLGLIGRPYETMFFGRDVLNGSPDEGRALLNHNRDIGMFANDRMVVLGLQKTVEFYEGNPKAAGLALVTKPKPEFLELEKNATAIYQVADDLYMHRLYRIDGMSLTSNTVAAKPALPPEK
jgi:phosphoglycerol transferase MdoB-like AlkP superfamily enzyme